MHLYLILLPLIAYILHYRIKNIKKAIKNKERTVKTEILLLVFSLFIIFLLFMSIYTN